MNHINPAKAGIAVGVFAGGLHLIWTILIAVGWAQPIVKFSMWAHMIGSPVTIKAFDASAALTLVVVAVIVGYAVGTVFARVWNRVHRG